MYGLNYVALRYFNAYGPRMDIFGAYTEVFIRWMNNIAEGRPPVVFGDGSQTMDFVHVEDIARANVLAAKATVGDRAFNIGSGTETSLKELAAKLLEAMDSLLVPQHAEARKVNPVPRRLADIAAAREMIGYEPTMSLEDGLRQLVAWWQEEQLAKAS
jgi:UDP-glucose 4-epimerase